MNEYFKAIPEHELDRLLNCPVVSFKPGSIILKRGVKNESIFIVLSGIVEYINHDLGLNNKLTVGTIVGEVSAMMGLEANRTYRAISYVKAIEVPSRFYMRFLKMNNVFYSNKENASVKDFLQNTCLFGERISSPQHSKIAQSIKRKMFRAGTIIPATQDACIFLLFNGNVEITSGANVIANIQSGECFGEDQVILKKTRVFKYMVIEDSIVYVIPSTVIEDIPIVQCKLLELFQRRIGLSEIAHFLERQ